MFFGVCLHCSFESRSGFGGRCLKDFSVVLYACFVVGRASQNAIGTCALLYLSYCADEMGITFEKPSVLEMDNFAAEVFTNNTATSTKLRHIDQRQHWVKVLRDKNIVKAKHVGTKDNIADIFTKPLEGQTFRSIRDMFLHDCTDICVQGGISMLEPANGKRMKDEL